MESANNKMWHYKTNIEKCNEYILLKHTKTQDKKRYEIFKYAVNHSFKLIKLFNNKSVHIITNTTVFSLDTAVAL